MFSLYENFDGLTNFHLILHYQIPYKCFQWFSSCHFGMHKHSRQLLALTLCKDVNEGKNGWAEVGEGSAQNQDRTCYTYRIFTDLPPF
jgi:hypothetical protein